MALAINSSVKMNGKSHSGPNKSWSLKDGILAFRRSLVPSSGGQSENRYPKPCARSLRTEPIVRHRTSTHRDIWHALSPAELPECACIRLAPVEKLSKEVFASVTGPNTGFLTIPKWHKEKSFEQGTLESWKPMQNRKAYGLSVSLYERNPFTNRVSGEPVADAFVVRARCDSAFLAVADGVNWGRDAMHAARCAIYVVYEYLERRLYSPNADSTEITSTREAAQLLFETFSAAQDLIIKCTSGLTTLCVALILPVAEESQPSPTSSASSSQSPTSSTGSLHSRQFALIVASVGDSQAFLLSKFHGIRELTGWVPRSTGRPDSCTFTENETTAPKLPPLTQPARDFRDCGGALGSVYADGSPELNNLICAVTLCDSGDLVILGTDGLTDNFDPVVTRVAVPESPQFDFMDDQKEPEMEHNSGSSGDHLDHATIPAKSWFRPLGLSPPSGTPVWPRPPPPPPPAPWYMSSIPTSPHPSLQTYSPELVNTPESPTLDSISARHLNFTNQLELSWSERRKYAGKEMERIWHETDATLSDPMSNPDGVASARDLCSALIAHAVKVTADKRELLQDPELARLRMTRAKLVQLNLPVPEDELGTGPVKAQRRWLAEMLRRTQGKLDHATVVVYEIGQYHGDENELYEELALV